MQDSDHSQVIWNHQPCGQRVSEKQPSACAVALLRFAGEETGVVRAAQARRSGRRSPRSRRSG